MRNIWTAIDATGSALLWTGGGLWFLVCFSVLSFGLTVSSPQRLFPLVRGLTRILMRIVGAPVTVSGLDRIGAFRPALYLGNHQSLFDLFVVPAALPGFAVGVEAASHFSLPLWGSLTRRWGNIPIPRGDRKKAVGVLDTARRRLRRGTAVVILPEGHRTRDGALGPFKSGPFHLALAAKADIVPFAVSGLFRFQSKGSFFLRPGRVAVSFGPPMPYRDFRDMSPGNLRDTVRSRIETLSAEARALIES